MRRAIVFSALLLIACSAVAQQGGAAAHYFANLSLVDQDGRRVDFYNDLMKGKTVIINSFFASCTGSCPVMGKTFQLIQNRLGDAVGRDVNLISITVDPATDTPAKLKAYAKTMEARPGWYFLTGTPDEVGAVLKKLGQYVDSRETHVNIFLVGNDRTGLWKKVFGLAKPADIYASVESVVNDTGAAPGGSR